MSDESLIHAEDGSRPPSPPSERQRNPHYHPAHEHRSVDHPEMQESSSAQMPQHSHSLSYSTSGTEASEKYDSSSFLNIQQAATQSPPRSPHGNEWQPGILRQFPWTGISALIGTVLCTFAAVAVLVISDGRSIDSWSRTVTPNVCISISTALANILLTYALYQGIVISFWRKAAKGATLLELHQYWSSGSSFHGALRGMFLWRGKVVAVACIFTILSILRGPLMQRASNVTNVSTETRGNLTVHSAAQLPLGYAGQDTGRTSTPSILLPNFTSILQSYSQRAPITLVHSDCGSTCYTSIQGFGFGVECNTTGIFYDLAPTVFGNGSVILADPVEVFATSAGTIPIFGHGGPQELDYYGNPSDATSLGGSATNTALLLNATFMHNPTTQSFNGTLVQHLCALRGGIVSYPVKIINGTVELLSESWRNDTFLEDKGLQPLSYNSISNIAGFVLAANNLYQSSATYQFGGAVAWILNFQGFMANQYLMRTSSSNYYDLSTNLTWQDPMDDMISGMREIAFRSAVQVARDNLTFPESVQRVSYTGFQPETVYTSNYQYMASAVVLSLLGVLAVIPTFRGWWDLGRRVTLSPLEVAKAFDAPLLRSAPTNASAEEMIKVVGGDVVRYGDASGQPSASGERRLQILHTELVRRPTTGAKYA